MLIRKSHFEGFFYINAEEMLARNKLAPLGVMPKVGLHIH
jgi:hypothetical protein